MQYRGVRLLWCASLIGCLVGLATAREKVERFDKDPGWEGHNNRSEELKPRKVRQDFGYSDTAHAGGHAGEAGGFISPAAEPAYYARKLTPKTFRDPLTASGRLVCKGKSFHALVGFFNADTLNEWRTPSSIVLRIQGRGDVFFAYVEYATSRWRAGGDSPGGFPTVRDPKTGRATFRGFATGKPLEWSLRYDPDGNKGGGAVTVTLGEEKAVCHLDKGHKEDGASFNRFGLLPVLKSADSGGEVWLGDLTIGGKAEDFSRDPVWEGLNNRKTYELANVRPRFDFGYSPTRHAGGQAAGELGGLLFRGDCRYPARMACYGDRLSPLTLEKPLKASGKVSLRRGVTDSTSLLGFYHSRDSMEVNPSQASGLPRSFMGVSVEGPSREGFLVYPAYRTGGSEQGHASGATLPHILPNGKPHDWSLEYDPSAAGGKGRIAVKLDSESVSLDLGAGHRAAGARFDRFGLVTTWVDGNGQHLYFDDLTYTCEQ